MPFRDSENLGAPFPPEQATLQTLQLQLSLMEQRFELRLNKIETSTDAIQTAWSTATNVVAFVKWLGMFVAAIGAIGLAISGTLQFWKSHG